MIQYDNDNGTLHVMMLSTFNKRSLVHISGVIPSVTDYMYLCIDRHTPIGGLHMTFAYNDVNVTLENLLKKCTEWPVYTFLSTMAASIPSS